jgi:predicted component of type VI protein secretion system
VREILNKVKEKKLKAIKSEISEISKLVSSNTNNELDDNDPDDFKKLESDTITLTKIVDNVSNNFDKHQLEEISEELKNIRITLAKQDTILRDILLKLDENN